MVIATRWVPLRDSAGRTHQHMTDNIVNQVLGSSTDIKSRDNLKEYRDTHDRFFFYIGNADEDWEIYQRIAASYPYMTWIHALDRGKIAHTNGIYFYDEREGTSDMRNGPYKPMLGGVMDEFTNKYLFLLRSLPDYAMERLFVHSQAAILLFYPDTSEERGVQIPFWHGVTDIKKHFLCIQIPIKDKRNTHELRQWLGVENELSPAVRIVDKKDGRWRHFQLRDKVTTESIKTFYKEYKSETLREFHRSEGPERDHGVVKKLVAKSYNKFIRRRDLDIVVVIHSNDNKTLSHRVLKVSQFTAKIMARFEYLRFGKINADVNSDKYVPQRGYPIIRLFKKGHAHHYVDYNGLYTTKDVSAWISAQIGVVNPFDEFLKEMKEKKRLKAEQASEDI